MKDNKATNISQNCKSFLIKNIVQFVICFILIVLSVVFFVLLKVKTDKSAKEANERYLELEKIEKSNQEMLLKSASTKISKIYDKEIKYSEIVLEKFPEYNPKNFIIYRYQGDLKLGFNNISVKTIDYDNRFVEYDISEPEIFHGNQVLVGEPDKIQIGTDGSETNPYSRIQKVKESIENVINSKTLYKQMSKDSIDKKLGLFTKKVLTDEWVHKINWIKVEK